RSHWSTSKTPSYTKSVSWQHHPSLLLNISIVSVLIIFLCDVSRDAKLLLIDSLIFLYLSFLNYEF
ncbi:hypothetical protein SM914_20030, partial [Escherichia coli]|nr:hypothetical protein [Escherichia coli]MDZ9016638.1 hypothetical protein [Escherichia coli]MDZ9159483.1 hypothetical protein [Escherichia coli]